MVQVDDDRDVGRLTALGELFEIHRVGVAAGALEIGA